MLVNLHHVARMRNDPQAPARGMCGDLKPLGDPANPGSVDLNNADGVGGDETGERLVRIVALARRNIGNGCPLQASVAVEIVCMDWLLDPVHPDFLEHGQETDRSRQLPPLVGVAHERDLVTNRLADTTDALRILAPIGLADLDLYPPPALVDQRADVRDQLVKLKVQPTAIGVIGFDRVSRPSEELPQRDSRTLSREVP